MKQIIPRHEKNTADVPKALVDELTEYRQLQQALQETHANLAELCTAMEEFNLTCNIDIFNDLRVIHCRDKAYTPLALRNHAHQQAALLESLEEDVSHARARLLAKILKESNSIAAFRAMRFAYVDDEDTATASAPSQTA